MRSWTCGPASSCRPACRRRSDRLADTVETILAEPEAERWAARTDSGRLLGVSRERFADFIQAELVRWRGIVEFAGAHLD